MTRLLPTSPLPLRSFIAVASGFLALSGMLTPLHAQAGAGTAALAPTSQSRPPALSADAARAIAQEAWLYAYAPLQGYQTLWNPPT